MQDAGDEAADAQFAKAMALTGAEFLDCVDYITHVGCVPGRNADTPAASEAAEAMHTTGSGLLSCVCAESEIYHGAPFFL